MQPRAVQVGETVAFDALGQYSGDRIHLANGILGMLTGGPGEVVTMFSALLNA